MKHSQSSSLEIWGGVECTVNRVRHRYFDQLERSGHAKRVTDLDLFAGLGIRSLRYPVLWEHHSSRPVDWSWADERLNRLRDYRMEPIVGLVHHGSGPPHTSLLDPDFPSALAAHAGAVARRHPWIKYYNPVNEPLTTARFSCLYGHWYPHKKDQLSFARAILIQCDAVRQSMRAIRKINPEAQLVQTEDMGKTFSTRLLAYQAEFENERRWLSLDLLCGRFDSNHPVWDYIRWTGVTESELTPFLEEPCPPDIVGINHYVASERFLDERLERYPAQAHGGNGRHTYADVAAVRVCANGMSGPRGILKDAWERFRLPVAVTEAHLGCTREEQIRWLMEVWLAAKALRSEGADIRAVTVWSLLGAYDWNSLLTRQDGYYEPGAFDLRGPGPRPTAIARCMRRLAAGRSYRHPALANEGWWRRPQRLLYPPVRPYAGVNRANQGAGAFRRSPRRSAKPILITGGSGTLAQAFGRMCDVRGLARHLATRQEMDIAGPAGIGELLAETKPWAVINAAGYAKVDRAEAEPERCFRENVEGPIRLAEACKKRNLQFITFSSDLVFDGRRQQPYMENDRVNPLNVYGQSKAAAERKVLHILPKSLVIRTGCFFGPWDEYNFVTATLHRLRRGERVEAVANAVVSPTYLPDLVNACLDLLIDGEQGIWHLANPGAVTWAGLADMVAKMAGARTHLIDKKSLEELNLPARRPDYSVLGSERGQLLRPLDRALETYFADRREFEVEKPMPPNTPISSGVCGQK